MAAFEVLALDPTTPQIRAPGATDTYVFPRAVTPSANSTGITISGYSLTGTNAQSLLDLSGTWNTTGTPTALKLNVTDTASNGNSLLMDLQVGGVSKANINKSGQISVTYLNLANARATTGIQTLGIFVAGASQPIYLQGYRDGSDKTWVGFAANYDTSSSNVSVDQTGQLNLSASTSLRWSNQNNNTFGTTFDLILARDAANTLAQRNGVNAQTSRIYNTFTDASNYERLALTWSSNVAYIKPENAGTGSARLFVPVTGSTTVAGLPAAATAGAGARAFVTDATATTFLSTVAGGGANKVPVVSDGTSWLIG